MGATNKVSPSVLADSASNSSAAPLPTVHVVAAALIDAAGQVLLAQRPSGKHLAGLWEFPGGKVEPGEDAIAALRRELIEEIGVCIGSAEPLIRIPWAYPGKSILLDVYRVQDFQGEAHSREGQLLQWLSPDSLDPLLMPPADHPVISALRLPGCYLVTPEPQTDIEAFCACLAAALQRGIRLVQLRAKHLPDALLRDLARRTFALTQAAGARLLINNRIDLALEFGLDGVHLTSVQLRVLSARPMPPGKWVAASCHDTDEIALAQRLGVDFLCVGAIQATPTHADASPLGWEGLARLCEHSAVPVYALGGMTPEDQPRARHCGAQGIAAIRSLWGA